jgi:uncharacterized protein YfaS (alpha-2-macroglobulin family)
LTSYVVSVTRAAGRDLPADVQRRVGDGLRSFVEGRIATASGLPAPDTAIRKIAAVDALARIRRADAALVDSIAIEPNLWPTSAVLDWWSVLRRLPRIRDRDARLAEAERIVRARLDLRGTTLRFSTEDSDRLWWLMVSPETNALRLLLELLDAKQWREDLPRLARGAVELQKNGAWPTTVANAWGTLALRKFAAELEPEAVSGTTRGTLAVIEKTIDWAKPAERDMFFAWPESPAELAVDHAGSGNPWLTISARAAIPLAEPLTNGLRITKTVTPVEPRAAGKLGRGDRLRVRLDVEAQSDLTWVVVDDPVPAGSSHLGTGLARDSQMEAGEDDAERPDRVDRILPAFTERSFDAFRAYYEYVPKGRFSVEYVVRLNQSGRFQLPTTRAEALYAPETFGELPNPPIEVEP